MVYHLLELLLSEVTKHYKLFSVLLFVLQNLKYDAIAGDITFLSHRTWNIKMALIWKLFPYWVVFFYSARKSYKTRKKTVISISQMWTL